MEKKLIEDITLLYVEDDEMAREEIEFFLKRRFKHVLIAKNGKEGLEQYNKSNPDIIITDIQMPIMTGLEMSKLIREKDKTTPLIITSAYSDMKFLHESIDIGINTYLIKPVDLTQLYCTLKITCENIYLERNNKETKKELNETQELLLEADKMANLGSLVAGVTHELNTPIGISLTSLSHFSDIVKEINKNYQEEKMTQEAFESFLKESSELSEMSYLNIKRASELIKNFKSIAVDQTSEIKREFKLKSYLEELIFSLTYLLKKTKIKVNIESTEEIQLNSYPGYFSQIFTNLITNSINHGYEHNQSGQIDITISKNDDSITIVYKDDGIGISEDIENNIFNAFFTTKENRGGTGLGLNIIKDIINVKLKGSIEYIRPEDKGVIFKIQIPKD